MSSSLRSKKRKSKKRRSRADTSTSTLGANANKRNKQTSISYKRNKIHNINNSNKLSLKKKGRGLNINLTASPIKSLTKNKYKSKSKPAKNTIDITINNNKHNHNNHNAFNAFMKKHTKIKSKNKTKKSSRYKKRISAPIILPTSKTPSLSEINGATTNTNSLTPATIHGIPRTPNTPYYYNPNTPEPVPDNNKNKKFKKKKNKNKNKMNLNINDNPFSIIEQHLNNNGNNNSNNLSIHSDYSAITTNTVITDPKSLNIRNKNSNHHLFSQYLGSNDGNSSQSHSHSLFSVNNSKSSTNSSIISNGNFNNSNNTSSSSSDNDENDQYLEETEINEMIRSCKRLSKSRPRAYSKTRRISQKLFGLMESISLDNNNKDKNGISFNNNNSKAKKRPRTNTITVSHSISNNRKDQLKFECNNSTSSTDADANGNGGCTDVVEPLCDGKDYHVTLRKYGYVEVKRIAKSLQGIVIEAEYIDKIENGWDSVIVKITNKLLHNNKISNKHGKSLSVQEDIIKEKKLLMYLTANNPPNALVKFLGFFEDKINYFLVQENGGTDFFDWIVKCHEWIRAGKVSLKQWNLYIHDLMLQIVEFIKWLHYKMNVCHLDISLENMLIKNNKYKSDGNGGIRLSRKMQLKFCDFGLAEYFNKNIGNDITKCSKYVGKTHYKAPRVYFKKELFDARAADIWSLGVSFFMMMIGAPPYKLPINDDDHFPLIQKGNIIGILKRWGRDHYINKYCEDLLNKILNINEKKRFNIYDIENHIWFKKNNKIKNKHKKKHNNNNKYPLIPNIHSNIMANYNNNSALMEYDQNHNNKKKKQKHVQKKKLKQNKKIHHHNIFQSLVMNDDDGQLFKYRKRKLTST